MTTISDLADDDTYTETPLAKLGVDLPQWLVAIDPDITPRDVRTLSESGCAANAHRACFYSDAERVMSDHGDDVLQYLDDAECAVSTKDQSWTGLASTCLSAAVEIWCHQAMDLDVDTEQDSDESDDD